jgi:Nif-specific regulatory protein
MDARLLVDLSREVTGTVDLQEVLDRSFAALRQLMRFDGGAIQLIDDGALVAAAAEPELSPEARLVRIPVGQGVSGGIAATGEPVYIPDVTVDERVHPEGRKAGLSGGVRSYFGVPLIMGGAPIGVVQVDSRRVDAFAQDARDSVLAFVPTIAAAVIQAKALERERDALSRALRATDGITQGLAVAKYALEAGQDEVTRSAIEDTLRQSREIISDLLGDDPPDAGDLRS